MSKIFVDQVDPKTATTLTLGTTGDTVDIPTGVTLSGAGTITASAANLAASGAGGVTGILPVANGGTGAATVPYARLGCAAAPSVATATYALAEYNSILFASDDSIVDTATYKITPGVTGTYYIAAHINYAPNAVDQTDYHLSVYIDGSSKFRNAIWASGTQAINSYGTDVFVASILELTDSNYVQCKVYQNSGSSAQYAYGDTTGHKNFFELFMITT